MSRLPQLLLAVALQFAAASPAEAALQVVSKPKVSFFAKGSPGALDIEGKTNDLTLTDDGTTVTFTVDMSTVSTGIDLRDHHMKDGYLHVATYPHAVMTFDRQQLKLPGADGASVQGTLQGEFTAHGVTLPATVTYSIKPGKKALSVDATFDYDVSKHGIAIPSYLGITVDPIQNARVRFDMVDQ